MSETTGKSVVGSGEQGQLSFRGVLGSVGLHLLVGAALVLLGDVRPERAVTVTRLIAFVHAETGPNTLRNL